MATKETEAKKGKFALWWDSVIQWYGRQAYAVGIIYSLGAAVVIIGALFKILHWQGASQVLMVGMFTEAFLFILGIFEKPHATYHWENAFPQLLGDTVKEVGGGNGAVGGNGVATGLEGVPTVSEKDMKALQEGIARLSQAAEQLASLGEVATATTGLVEKMHTAGAAAETFATTQATLLTATEGVAQQYSAIKKQMEAAVGQVQAYGQGVESLNAQLSSVNAVYELQLKEIQAQAAALNAQTAVFNAQTDKLNGVNTTIDTLAAQATQLQQSATASLEASNLYVAGQQKLAAQIADLNKVYGNMLSAL